MPPTSHVAVSAFQRGHVLVGRYVLERLLGEGGMGTVWRARQLTTDKPVALKFLKGDDPADRARFLREAKVAAGLSHRNIVQVFDFWELEDGGPVFLVMELLSGESLAQLLSHRGALALAEMVTVLMPVAQALAAAHAEGIVHRDLKPENVFLARTRSGEIEVKVVDFGLARQVTAPEGATSVTQTGAVMGTPHYMAPEQVYGEGDVDARADVWALGVILYQCATGRLPFDGENFGQIFRAITQGRVGSVLAVRPELPPTLDLVVQRALSHERNARPRMDVIARVIATGFSPLHFSPTMPASDPPPRLPASPSYPPPPSHRSSRPPPVGQPAVAAASTLTDAAVSNARHAPPSVLGVKAIGIGLLGCGFLAVFAAGMVLARQTSAPRVVPASESPPALSASPPAPAPVPASAPAVPVSALPIASASAPAPGPAPASADTTSAPDAGKPVVAAPAGSSRRHGKPAPGDPAALLNQGRF